MLRLEEKCSITSISDILKKMELTNNSAGEISQKLSEIGRYLPNTLEIDNDATLYVYLSADEMFSHSTLVLISVDPISTSILRIELAESRKMEDWIKSYKAPLLLKT